MSEVADIIAYATDADLLIGLARRGVAGTRKLSDGKIRVVLKLRDNAPAKPRPRRIRRQSEVFPKEALL